MIYIYLDESGDLWFDFENKKPSEFFTSWLKIFQEKVKYDELWF